ncbi:MAG: YfiR family protein [Alphaproteobacteria bacterium]|nr:YfiR family protein [Alphaproteobacteria bacterium]
MIQGIRRLAILVIGACMLAMSVWIAGTQADDRPARPTGAKASREYLLKAAFLYNFAKFTSWPTESISGAGKPVRLCILGKDPFGAALESIEGKNIQQRPLVTIRIARVSDAEGCQIIFIASSEEVRLRGILSGLRELPILTIAEMSNFARVGGIIGLKTVEDRIRFDINVDAAKEADLKFSYKLLQLADIVSTETR